jgi:hypothetical protein
MVFWKPQILTAMIIIGILGVMAYIYTAAWVDQIVPSAITAVGMLGMKLLEKE